MILGGAAARARRPSMMERVAEVRRARRARRCRCAAVVGALAVTLVAATAAGVAHGRAAGPGPRAGGAARLAPVWSAERSAALEAAMGPAAWAELGPAIARFAGDWIAGHAAAGGGDLGRPMACLARARAELDGFIDELFAQPPDPAGPGAPEAGVLARLTAPATCVAVAPAAPAEPASPPAAARVARAARVIARAEVAIARGAGPRAALLSGDALALARAAGSGAQLAQALAVRARALAVDERAASAAVAQR
jgi:hypothetical protein